MESRLKLGEMFQLAEHIWNGPNEALCRLRIEPQSEVGHNQGMYPVYVDTCIQIIVSIVHNWAAKDPVTYLPVGIDKFIFYESPRPGQNLWCHTKLADGSNLEMPSLSAEIYVCDDDGRVLCRAIGFRVGRASREQLAASLQEDLSGFMYTPSFDQVEEEIEIEKPEEQGSWLVVPDQTMASGLVDKLTASGEVCVTVQTGSSYSVDGRTVTIDPLVTEHYIQMMKDGKLWDDLPEIRGIVHLSSIDCTDSLEPSFEQLEESHAIGSRSVLHLSQALAEMKSKARLRLVTRGSQAVAEGDKPMVCAAPVWGMGKVIELEVPRVRAKRVDLGTGDQLDLLVNEILSNNDEDEVVLRDGARFVSRIVPKKKTKEVSVQMKADHTYIITGGFGGLGLLVAKKLVERGARDITLLGRRGAPASVKGALQDLTEKGVTVRSMKADVASEEDIMSVVSTLEAAKIAIAGVMHAAGYLDDKQISKMDWESVEIVMASKVKGTRNLHVATKHLDLHFFVLFSSASSAIGNVGQANYAAANAFMDTFAHARRAAGLAAMSINWGPWAEVGMAAAMNFDGGLNSLPAAQGIGVFLQSLGMADTAQMVVAAMNWMKFLQAFGKQMPAIFRSISGKKKKGGSGSDSAVKKKLMSYQKPAGMRCW